MIQKRRWRLSARETHFISRRHRVLVLSRLRHDQTRVFSFAAGNPVQLESSNTAGHGLRLSRPRLSQADLVIQNKTHNTKKNGKHQREKGQGKADSERTKGESYFTLLYLAYTFTVTCQIPSSVAVPRCIQNDTRLAKSGSGWCPVVCSPSATPRHVISVGALRWIGRTLS